LWVMKMEPKILPSSLREKKRYIIFKIISESNVTYSDFVNAMWNSMLNFLGELKTSEVNTWIIQNLYNEEEQTGVIRCSHKHVEEVRAALALISVIGESKSVVKVLGVTGTIKSAKMKYISGGKNGL